MKGKKTMERLISEKDLYQLLTEKCTGFGKDMSETMEICAILDELIEDAPTKAYLMKDGTLLSAEEEYER